MLSLSPGARAGLALAALLLVGMLAVLVAVLVSLEGTRSEIRTTRAGVVDADLRVQRVTRQLEPLLGTDGQRDLRQTTAQVADSVNELPALARRVRSGVDAATFVARLLEQTDLRGTLAGLRTLRTLPDIRDQVREQRRLNRISTSTQRRQLSLTRRMFALLSQSLAVQRETLDHTRSLDRKTGSPPPAAPPATPPVP